MMENGKRLLSLLMVISMLFSMMPLSAGAQEQEEEQVVTETLLPEKTELEDSGVPQLPSEDGAVVSIAEAAAAGKAMEHDTYTELRYKVTGEITEVSNATYGNLMIQDEYGNSLKIYGTYDATGEVGYNEMACKPIEGDVVTIYGRIGQYSGVPQIKNGWIVEHVCNQDPVTPDVPDVTVDPEPTEPEGTNPGETGQMLELGVVTNITITEAGNDAVFLFIPEESGSYYLSSSSAEETYGDLYELIGEEREFILGWTGYKANTFVPLEAGHTYLLQTGCSYNTPCSYQVKIEKTPVESIVFDPVTILPGTYGWVQCVLNEETQTNQMYYHYPAWDILQAESNYTITFKDGTVLTGWENEIVYDGLRYEMKVETNQGVNNPWLPGNTYTMTVELMGQRVEVPVTIAESPLESIVFKPLTVIEGTCGYVETVQDQETGEQVEFFYYAPWSLGEHMEYVATFKDGSTQEDVGFYGLYYQEEWYSASMETTQDSEHQWTPGNTYYVDVFALGQCVQVPVTVVESPLQSIAIQPISVIEGNYGFVDKDWNPETNKADLEYFHYEIYRVLNKANYTITFTDGTVKTGTGRWIEYDGKSYELSYADDQSYENQWTVGNTYYMEVSFMGQSIQVPVTIVPTPVASVAVQPLTMHEGRGGVDAVYYPGDGNEHTYYEYYWWNKLTYTITFTDGTSTTVSRDTEFEYNGETYSIEYANSQSYYNQWTLGHTYTCAIYVLGVSAEVSISIEQAPVIQLVQDVPADVVILEDEHYGELKFTPEKDGVYFFTSDSDVDTKATLYEGEEEIAYDDDGGEGSNFLIDIELKAGHTYVLRASEYSDQACSFQVKVTRSPLESIQFQPISMLEGTCGNIAVQWLEETQTESAPYYQYAVGSMLQQTSYTATFTDGTVITGNSDCITYNGQDYELNLSTEQPYNNPWTAGNTYSLVVKVMGLQVEVPVTIVDLPVENIVFDPILVVAGTCGSIVDEYNPETGSYDLPYFCYDANNILELARFSVIYTDGTAESGVGSTAQYNDGWYSFATYTNQSYANPWTVGNTYTIEAFLFGVQVQVPVTIIDDPVESVVVEPIVLENETNGSWYEEYEGRYYRYFWSNQVAYTITFRDGTVLRGDYENPVTYNGATYKYTESSDQQSAVNRWLVGNSYTGEVKIGGVWYETSVTIKELEIPVLELDVPVSVKTYEDGRNYAIVRFTPEVSGGYIFTSISDIDTYGDLYEETEDSTEHITYNDDGGEGNNFRITVFLEAGHTYTLQARELNWYTSNFQVVVTRSPVQSITFEPVTIMPGTHGSIHTGWNPDTERYDLPYYMYYAESLLDQSSFTATFTDGTIIQGKGSDGGFTYQDTWYSFSCNNGEQCYETPWLPGNTYTLYVEGVGVKAELSVNIMESPLQSITMQPVNIIEGSNGMINTDSNPDDENQNLQYYHYYVYSILSESKYTATFTDGTTKIGYGSESIIYNDQWYSLDAYAYQNYNAQWEVGNTYMVDVFILGQQTQVPVTIVPSPVVSLTAEPVTVYEHVGGNWNGDGENAYYCYYWWQKVDYYVSFNDGTSATIFDGYGYNYNGEEFFLSTMDDQGPESQWVAGNTYTATINFMGASAEVRVTVESSPLKSVVFDPIVLEEHAGGYWSWSEDGEYYRYSWLEDLKYTATFLDGTVRQGSYWNTLYYDGINFGISTYIDPQGGETPWLVNNTYSVQVQLGNAWYDVYVTIAATTEENGFTYITQGSKAIINGCTLKTKILQIPDAIDGYQVAGITSLGNALAYAEEIRIPDSVTMLSAELFDPYGCNAIPLKKLILGKGITTLSAIMLSNAPDLEQIVVAKDNPALSSIDGVLYNKDQTALVVYPAAKQELHKIPDSVTDISALINEDRVYYYKNLQIQFGAGIKDYKQLDGIIYTEDMTQIVKATGAAVGSYVMPDTVTSIAAHAFSGSKLTSVAVSPSVTYLSYTGFYEAINLEEISVPTSVEAVGCFQLSGCEGLKKVHITDLAAWCRMDGGGGLLYYAHDLYLNGEKIVDLVIPKTVAASVYHSNRISEEAFAYGSFETVTIPAEIQAIGYDAFKDCKNLKKVNISDLAAWCGIQFENEGANPLSNARNLYLNGGKVTNLVIPELVTSLVYTEEDMCAIGDYAFYNADIAHLTVPSYIYGIGAYAFAGSSVKEIVLEEGVARISVSAFQESDVKSVTLPDSLNLLDIYAFADCTKLEQLTIGRGLRTIPTHGFSNTALKSVVIPKQVTYLGSYAFAESPLTQVDFLGEDVQIGWRAFRNCPLGDLKLGENIVYIEEEGFNGISATQVWHPSTVTQISYRVYALNPNLVSVTIPKTVQCIQPGAFEGDYNLSHVLYTGTQEQWEDMENYSQELYEATVHFEANGDEVTTEQTCTTIRMYCSICKQWETIRKVYSSHQFENGVCTICKQESFWEYDVVDGEIILTEYQGNDTDVTVPDQIDGLPVTVLAEDLFAYNRKITSVTLPDSLTRISKGAFRFCTSLKTVVSGSKLVTIEDEAFAECHNLKNINLPNGLVKIGEATFCRCFNLTVAIPESVRSIGAMAFYDCDVLERVEIPVGVTEISDEAFANCWNLSEVVLSNTVTKIGYYAFSGAAIQELIVPASVQEICSEAFAMNGPQTVIFEGDQPILSPLAFENGAVTAFYAASNKTWKELPDNYNRWYACKVPVITSQPKNQTVQPGEEVTLTAQAKGQRLRYQWYYAMPNAKVFTPVGGNRMELTVTVDQTNSGARAYCVVTDLLGQTAKTDTVTLKNIAEPTGIRLNQLPYTLEYDLRQELRTRGLEVMLIFNDNTQEKVENYTVSGYNANVSGAQTITVAYNGFTATFQVTVNEEKLNFTDTQQKVELSAPEGAVEPDAELVVQIVEPEEALPEVPETPEILQSNAAVIFDITLEKAGETVQPTETVQVSIPVPEHMESKRCKVYYIDDNGNATDMNATYRDGRMVFDTDHFSYYAIVETVGVTISGTISGSNQMAGVVVRLISGGEVLESVSVSRNGTYVFENVTANDYVIEVVQEGMATIAETVTVADQDVRKDFVCYYVAVEANGQQTQYSTLAQAMENAPAGGTVQLLGSLTEDVTVTKELVLDLNGCDLNGDIAVDGGMLLVKDSRTDDYTILDVDGYGKLNGTTNGVQAADGYMMIAEAAGVSFHRIDLTLTDMTLRPSAAGVYYKSNFAGDEVVAQNVSRYGVALSVQGEPTVEAPGILSWYDSFAPGAAANAANGTLLYGVLKHGNSDAGNAANAQLPVYGSAYILTNDGKYIFGEVASRSFKEQVEAIDGLWDALTAQQRNGLLAMYEEYQSVMESWNLSNIKRNSQK